MGWTEPGPPSGASTEMSGEEIARMLSGAAVTDEARAQAARLEAA